MLWYLYPISGSEADIIASCPKFLPSNSTMCMYMTRPMQWLIVSSNGQTPSIQYPKMTFFEKKGI